MQGWNLEQGFFGDFGILVFSSGIGLTDFKLRWRGEKEWVTAMAFALSNFKDTDLLKLTTGGVLTPSPYLTIFFPVSLFGSRLIWKMITYLYGDKWEMGFKKWQLYIHLPVWSTNCMTILNSRKGVRTGSRACFLFLFFKMLVFYCDSTWFHELHR